MLPLETISAACAILVDPTDQEGFSHLGTAWSVAPGEWITVWNRAEPPPKSLRLISTRSGAEAAVATWEAEGAVVGFTSLDCGASLALATEGDLAKRQPLEAVGYPSVIDHPVFRLHRGSLSCERYFPYLCPWQVQGHLALFSREEGFLAGVVYPGMVGGPVLADDGRVVGVLVAENHEEHAVPLARFHRFI